MEESVLSKHEALYVQAILNRNSYPQEIIFLARPLHSKLRILINEPAKVYAATKMNDPNRVSLFTVRFNISGSLRSCRTRESSRGEDIHKVNNFDNLFRQQIEYDLRVDRHLKTLMKYL